MTVDLFSKRQNPQWRLLTGARGRAQMPTIAKPNSFQVDTLFFPIRGRNHAIFVAIELTSRWGFARLYKSTAPTAAQSALFLDELNRIHPVEYLTADRGSEFAGRPVIDWAARQLVVLLFADANDMQSTGTVEAFNRTLRLLLTRYAEIVSPNINDDALTEVVNQYNSHRHSATSVAPNRATRYDLDRIRDDADERAQPYRDLISRFKPGTAVRVWLGANPAWNNVERAQWTKYHKTGVRWTRQVYTVQTRDGFKLRLIGQDERFSPRDLLALAPREVAHIDDDAEAVLQRARMRHGRKLRREELIQAALDVERGLTPTSAAPTPKRRRRPVAIASTLQTPQPKRVRAPRIGRDYVLESIITSRGTGDGFRLLVTYRGVKTPSWQPIESFIHDGAVNSDVYDYLKRARKVRASGI